VGQGWRVDTILLAHDAVVRRLQALDPGYSHTSPLSQSLQASVMRGVVPMLLVPDYVTIVGGRVAGRTGDLDVVVRDEKASESLEIRLGQALGERIHLIYNPQGPHDAEYRSVYHLALVPDAVWQRMKGVEGPVSTALTEFRAGLEGVLHRQGLRHAILGAAGSLARAARSRSRLEAIDLGRDYAVRVLAGETFHEPLLASTRIRWAMVEAEAENTYRAMMLPLTGDALRAGLRMIAERLATWRKENPFEDQEDALEGARELAMEVAQAHGG